MFFCPDKPRQQLAANAVVSAAQNYLLAAEVGLKSERAFGAVVRTGIFEVESCIDRR